MDPADSAPTGDEPTSASSAEAPAPDQPDAGDVTGTQAPVGAEQSDETATHEATDPDALGDFTAPPDGTPELIVDDDEDGGDTDD